MKINIHCLCLLFTFFYTNASSQTYDAQEAELQQKYFNLRDHFHKAQIFVGSEYIAIDYNNGSIPFTFNTGTSIPIEKVKSGVDGHYICRFKVADGTPGNFSQHGWFLDNGDGVIKIGKYLTWLATEYKLLNDEGKDVSEVLNEIYYALNALERIDANCEQSFGYTSSDNLNGFFQRDDVPYNMFTKIAREGYGRNYEIPIKNNATKKMTK